MLKLLKAHSQSQQQGFTLMEILVAAALSSIALLGLAALVRNSQKSANSIFDNLEIESIRNTIRLKMSCENTISRLSGTGEGIALFNKRDENLFPTIRKNGGEEMDAGKNYLRVRSYEPSTGELMIYIIDKKTNKEKPLFTTAPYFCKPELSP